jgi:hypothetical protein
MPDARRLIEKPRHASAAYGIRRETDAKKPCSG